VAERHKLLNSGRGRDVNSKVGSRLVGDDLSKP